MPPETIIAALGGVVTTLALAIYRLLTQRIAALEAENRELRKHFYVAAALNEMVVDEPKVRR